MAFLVFHVIILSVCAGNKINTQPGNMGNNELTAFPAGEILESQDGFGPAYLPDWMFAFINGGIAETEKLDSYQDKYLFIGKIESDNFNALSKWAKSFTVDRNFPALAAARIEKRLISGSSLNPDDEYGIFFETLVKKAYGGEYPGAVTEEIYWIKIRRSPVYGEPAENVLRDMYEFFVLVSIDKTAMQTIIKNMITETITAVKPARAQRAAINRLQQFFFEGF